VRLFGYLKRDPSSFIFGGQAVQDRWTD